MKSVFVENIVVFCMALFENIRIGNMFERTTVEISLQRV